MWCLFRYTQKAGHLKIHSRFHSGEKRYKSEVCLATFNQTRYLKIFPEFTVGRNHTNVKFVQTHSTSQDIWKNIREFRVRRTLTVCIHETQYHRCVCTPVHLKSFYYNSHCIKYDMGENKCEGNFIRMSTSFIDCFCLNK